MNFIFTLNFQNTEIVSDQTCVHTNKREHSQNNQRNDNGTDEY